MCIPGILLLCTAVFGVIGSLYGLPAEAILYAAVLCLALGGAVALWQAFRLRQRRAVLQRLLQNVQETVIPLPEPGSSLERDYQALVQALCQDRTRRASEMEARRQVLLDDFTLWTHQIKTPMTAMELLLESPEPDTAALSAELVKVNGYVTMAMTCLRLDGDSTDFVFRPCSLDSLIQDAVRKHAGLFAHLDIALDLIPTCRTVVTDAQWFSFVLEQLLSNALKYTPSGGRIRISLEGGTLVIADTGIGIPADELPRVFEKGYTGSTGRTSRRSSGLGLYLCRRVLNSLNCSISLTSSPGQGTAARIVLPAAGDGSDCSCS